MATLVLGTAGAAIGGSIGGAIFGLSAATIGAFTGPSIGSVIDSWIISSLAPAQRIEGARLDTPCITSAIEGAVIPRVYGRMWTGGNIIRAADFREQTKTTTQGGGKGGGRGKVRTTGCLHHASFAVALCEGPITGIGRIWADGSREFQAREAEELALLWHGSAIIERRVTALFCGSRFGHVGSPASPSGPGNTSGEWQ